MPDRITDPPQPQPSDLVGTLPEDLRYALELRYINYVKNCFILSTRAAFANRFTPEQYRYSADKGQRQLSIYRAWNKRQSKYPCIVVETETGDFSVTSLGHEEGYEVDRPKDSFLEQGVMCTGILKLPVSLRVMALSPTDREKITDLLSIYVRFVFRGKFYRENIPFLDISSGEDGEDTTADNKPVFLGKVTIRTQTEFKQEIDLSCFEAVNSLDFSGLLFGTSNADLQPNEGV